MNTEPKEVMTSESQDTTNTDPECLPESIQVGQLPIDLRFDVGCLKVSLDRLMGLRCGSVFQLEHSLEPETIKIMANGSLVAQGELVTLGDVVGVRVTRLHAKE